jgi:diguanylate cyclase (GGDEF)-like protein
MAELIKIFITVFLGLVLFFIIKFVENRSYAFLFSSLIFIVYFAIFGFISGADIFYVVPTLFLLALFLYLIFNSYVSRFDSIVKALDSAEKEIKKSQGLNFDLEQFKEKKVYDLLSLLLLRVQNELSEAKNMNNYLIYLTNFARYSVIESDKRKVLLEVGNFLEYVFPKKKISVFILQDSEHEILKGKEFVEPFINQITRGKLEDDSGGYISFPLLKNGGYHGFIVVFGDLNLAERNFVFIVSKFAESIMKRIDKEKEIELKAITDPLTGIYNRRYFISRLEQNFEKFKRTGRVYAVAIFDIDKFKSINDTYGHIVGDGVLRTFSSVLKSSVRKYDVPARFGGDEFVLLLDEIEKENAVGAVKRISTRFSMSEDLRAIITEGISVSWGLASVNEAPSSYDEIIKLADKRLLKAKELGGDRGVWE